MAQECSGRLNCAEETKAISLDAADRKILSLLAQNSRIPVSHIARFVKISRDSVSYRIKRMVDHGIIMKFVPLLSLSDMGYKWYHLFLLFDESEKIKQGQFIELIKNHPNTKTVLEYSDRWDLEVIMIAKDVQEFDEIVTEMISRTPEIVREKNKAEIIKFYKSVHVPNSLCFTREDYKGGVKEDYLLDDKDLKIIELLGEDCRLSTYNIGNQTGLSADSVSYRIKKIINAGYIEKFTVMVNFSKLNLQWFTFAVQITSLDKKNEIKFMEFVKEHPHIIRAVKTLGRWDLLLHIVADSLNSFHKTVKMIKTEFSTIINTYQTWVGYCEHVYCNLPPVVLDRIKKKKVMVFGTFDVLHPGHLSLFTEAKKRGDHLTVIVARNSTVKEVKGSMPKYNEVDRLNHVKGIKIVDEAVLGNSKDKYKVIKEIKPDVICLGYDQHSFTDSLNDKIIEFGMKIKIIRLKAYKKHKYKSSKLK